MANLLLTSGARFRPFTLEEYIKPYQIYTEAYNQIDEGLANLGAQAGTVEQMAMAELAANPESKTGLMYQKYANDLKAQADALATTGKIDRHGLNALKARYTNEVGSIQKAIEARAKEVEEQRVGSAAGLVYEDSANTASLDRYLGNTSIRYGQANAKEGFDRLSKTASALSQKLRDFRENGRMDESTKKWIKQFGYTEGDIYQAINDIQSAMQGDVSNIKGNAILDSLLTQEMAAAGVSDWNQAAKMQYFSKVAPALYQAIGKEDAGMFEDYASRQAQQLAKEKELANYKNDLDISNYVTKQGLKDSGDNSMSFPTVITGVNTDAVTNLNEQLHNLVPIENPKTREVMASTKKMQNAYRQKRLLEAYLFGEGVSQNVKDAKIKEFEEWEDTAKAMRGIIGSNASAEEKGKAHEWLRTHNKPSDYDQLKELSKIQKDIDIEKKYIDDLDTKYSHLGGSHLERIAKGLQLESAQAAQLSKHNTLNVEQATYDKIRKGFGNILNSIKEDQFNHLVNSETGKKLDKEDAMDLFSKDNIGNLTYNVDFNRGLYMSDGENEYEFKNIPEIEDANKDIVAANKALSDFSNSVSKNIIKASSAEIESLRNEKTVSNKLRYIPVSGSRVSVATLQDESGNIHKFVKTPGGIFYNTLEDELSGGSERDLMVKSLVSKELEYLKKYTAQKTDD